MFNIKVVSYSTGYSNKNVFNYYTSCIKILFCNQFFLYWGIQYNLNNGMHTIEQRVYIGCFAEECGLHLISHEVLSCARG